MKITNSEIGLILKSMRGKRSQAFITKRLQHSSNMISKWESGEIKIKWMDFLNLCLVCKINLNKIFKNFFHYHHSLESQKDLLAFMTTGKNKKVLAEQLGLSYYKLLRIQKNQSPLYLIDLLNIIALSGSAQLVSFLSTFINLSEIPNLKEEEKRMKKVSNLSYKEPDIAAIICALELTQLHGVNKNKAIKEISKLTGLTHTKTSMLIDELCSLKIIEYENNKFSLLNSHIDDRSSDYGTNKIRSHWLKRAAQALDKNDVDKAYNSFGSVVFPTNLETRKQIISLYLSFYEDFVNLVQKDNSPKDLLQVLSFQLFEPRVRK